MKSMEIGVIGGGASGMMAAIVAARKGANVTIIEGNDRLGKKILVTGNGKCNLTNVDLNMSAYYCEDKDKLLEYFKRFDQSDTINFFNGIGLLSKDKNGYVYPLSEQASTVLDALRFEIEALGINVITGFKVNNIYVGDECNYKVSNGETELEFDRIILCCGGKSAPKTGSDGIGFSLAENLGHTIVPSVPALCGLKCKESYIKAISGVRAVGSISVYKDDTLITKEKGEIQFTDYGISGIPVFQISRVVNYLLRDGAKDNLRVEIDFFDLNDNDFNSLMWTRKLLLSDRSVEKFFSGILNKKIMSLFVKLCNINVNAKIEEISEEKIQEVYNLCRCFTLHIIGSNDYDQSQVTAGGIAFDEIDENLQSIYNPGLYFAGEIIDVDGKCGGYNLQWAWSSGYIAGTACSE